MKPIVTLQLTGSVQAELILEEAEAVPCIFSAAEVRDLTQKTGNTTRTLKIADTKENHKALGMVFDVNTVTQSFNVNKAEPCILLQDGIPIMDNSVLQLTRVIKVQNNTNNEQIITYEGIVKDQTANFFTKLGNAELTDLKLDDLDHGYTSSNVIDSFTNTVTDGFKYVLPLTAGNILNLNDFRMGVYAKTYFDRIFQAAGFSYEWDDLTGENTRFDKFIIPYNGDVPKVRADVAEVYRVEANKTTEQDGTGIATTGQPKAVNPFQVTIPNETIDASNSYNDSTSIYTSPLYYLGGGNVAFSLMIEWEVVLVNDSGSSVFCVPTIGDGTGMKYTPKAHLGKNGQLTTGGTKNLYSGGANISYEIKVFNDTELPIGETVIGSETSNVTFNGTLTNNTTTYTIAASCNTFTNTARWRDTNSTSAAEVSIDTIVRIKSVQMVVTPSMSELGYNQRIYANDFIPKKVKQSDFIKSIFTLNNLMVEVDQFNSNKLILKSRDEYFDGGKVVNWTDKLDRKKEQNIIFLPSLTSKKTVLTYQEDKDAPNTDFQKATNEIYGQLEYTYDSEHVKGVDTKELIFSPTPIKVNDFGAVVPMISGAAPKTNIRLLYNGGEYTCGSYMIVDYIDNTGAPIGTTTTNYPLISHFDSPFNPSFDLNFGTCDYYYYQLGTLTNNTRFNLKWRRTMAQMNEGSMLIAYFDLNERDISTIKLSDRIEVDSAFYNINKIEYNANSRATTKVELIETDDEIKTIPFFINKPQQPKEGDIITNSSSGVISGGYTVANVADENSTITFSGVNNTASGSTSGAVYGSSNNIQAPNAVVIGNGLTALKSGLTSENLEVTQDTNLKNLPTINGGTLASALTLNKGLITVDITHDSNKEMYAPTTFIILGVVRISGTGNLVITVDSEEKEEGDAVNIGDLMEFSTDHSHGVFNVEIYAENAGKYYVK